MVLKGLEECDISLSRRPMLRDIPKLCDAERCLGLLSSILRTNVRFMRMVIAPALPLLSEVPANSMEYLERSILSEECAPPQGSGCICRSDLSRWRMCLRSVLTLIASPLAKTKEDTQRCRPIILRAQSLLSSSMRLRIGVCGRLLDVCIWVCICHREVNHTTHSSLRNVIFQRILICSWNMIHRVSLKMEQCKVCKNPNICT